ncbi:MAG: hypothetical protein H8K04_12225 [Nitrospira sp.]
MDCPEKKQALGQRAKQATSTLSFGQNVTIESTGKNRYGRRFATVVPRNGQSGVMPFENRANQAPVLQIQVVGDSQGKPCVNRRLEVRFLSPAPYQLSVGPPAIYRIAPPHRHLLTRTLADGRSE